MNKQKKQYLSHKNNTISATHTKKSKVILKCKYKKYNESELKCLEHQIEREFSKGFQKTVALLFLMAKDDNALFKKNMHKLLDSPNSDKLKVDTNLDYLYKQLKRFHKKGLISQQKNENQEGGVAPEGPYLQRLTTIGDQPITGNDMAKAIEEIITVLNDLQYLQEDGGPNIRGFNVLLNYFNGDTENMKYFLRYYFAPQFYQWAPPFLKFDEIGKRLDNIIDMLNVYKSDKRIKNQFAVETGVKPKAVLGETFADKLISKWDSLDQAYSKLNRVRRLQFY